MKYYFLSSLLILTGFAKEINLNKADKIVEGNKGYYVNICELFPTDKKCEEKKLLTEQSTNHSGLKSSEMTLMRETFKKEKSSNLRDQRNYYLDNINSKNLNEILLFTIDNFNMLENFNNIDLFLDAISELLAKKLGNNFDSITFKKYINNKNYSLVKIKQLYKESKIYSDDKFVFYKKKETKISSVNNKTIILIIK
jgi:hypothetical protein